VAVNGPDGLLTKVRDAGHAPFIPGVGRIASMVDLRLMLNGVASPQPSGLQVWLSRDDPAAERALGAALASSGITVLGRSSAAQAADELKKEGAVLALLLFLACGAVAVLVATGALLVAAFVGSRQRSAELASLRAVGVRRRLLRRGLLVENLAGVMVAAVAAIGAAAVAAVVVLPVLPMADEDSRVLTPDTSPDLTAFGWTVLGVCVWLAVLAVGVAVRQLRSSGADRIRDGGR
jgi:hypothetical protein